MQIVMGAPCQISADFSAMGASRGITESAEGTGCPSAALLHSFRKKSPFFVPVLRRFSSKSALMSHTSILKLVRSESKPAFCGWGLQRRLKIDS